MEANGFGTHFVLGTMFGGKSSELRRRVMRCRLAKCPTFVYRPCKDTRHTGEEEIQTHDGGIIAKVKRITLGEEIVEDLLKHTLDKPPVIALDEGQWVPDLRSTIEKLETIFQGKYTFHIAALDGDFQRRMWKSISDALPLATSFYKITAICMNCSAFSAPYTKRIAKSTEQDLPGGSEMYSAVCVDCYHK